MAIILYVLSLPLSSIRIPFAATSVSITSCAAIVLCVIIFLRKQPRRRVLERPLWGIALLCVIAFLPSLILHPSLHAAGVVVEWMIIPIATAFCLTHYPSTPQKTSATILTATFILLTVLIIDACIAAYAGWMTFDNRIIGNIYTSPNHLAMMIAPLLLLLAPLHTTLPYPRWIVRSVLLGATVVLFLTQSLSSLCAFAIVGFLLYVVMYRPVRRTIWFVLVLVLLLCVGAVAFKSLHGPLLHTHSSLTSRVMIWDAALFLVRTQPLFGHDIDSFQSAYLAAQPFFPPYQDWAVPTPHNLSLTLLFSGGILALTAYILLFARIVFLGTHYRRYILVVIPVFVIILMLVTGLADTPLWKIDLSHLLWITISLVVLHLPKNAHCA